MALEFKEEWPKSADSVRLHGGTLIVYADSAMFSPDESSDGYEESHDVWLSPDAIRDMRKALEWAERRLAGRS